MIDALFSENVETTELLAERIEEIVDNSDNLSDDKLRDALCDLVFTFIDKCKVYVNFRIYKQMIAPK